MRSQPILQTTLLTLLALVAFAANSILCRYALAEGSIDAVSFTSLRLASGACVLLLIILLRHGRHTNDSKGSWSAGFMLFAYACSFSFAYLILGAAMGALILFGVVQITMVIASLRFGHKPHISEWLGLGIAFSGLIYLLLPGLHAPPLSGFLLMALSGTAWAIYSLKGQQSSDAILDTGYNFIRTLPFVVILLLVSNEALHVSSQGLVLALSSGAITSALGYMIWYRALRDLSGMQAAVTQLFVPALTAFAGVLFLGEHLSLRLLLASSLILGGILLVVLGRYYFVNLKLKA